MMSLLRWAYRWFRFYRHDDFVEVKPEWLTR